MSEIAAIVNDTDKLGHVYKGLASTEGYGICSKCGCRENTDRSAQQCTELAKKLASDIFQSCGSDRVSRMAFRVGCWAQGTEQDFGGVCLDAMQKVIAESIHRHTFKTTHITG